MPKFGAKKVKYPKKKFNFRKKFKKNMNKITSIKTKSLYLPDLYQVPIKYTYIGNTLNTVSDDFNLNAWKLNSPSDSGLTLSANNALGFSTYSALYKNFFVYASSIKVSIVNMDVDIPMRITLLPTTIDTSTTITSTTDINLLANPYAKSIIIGNATGDDAKTIKDYISLRKLSGRKDLNSSDYEYVGQTSTHENGLADPPQCYMWLVAAQALSNVSDNLDLLVSVEITFYCQFFNRVTVQ